MIGKDVYVLEIIIIVMEISVQEQCMMEMEKNYANLVFQSPERSLLQRIL
jgi:hypothetical protein